MRIVFADEARKRRSRRAVRKVAVFAAVLGSAAYLTNYLTSEKDAVPAAEHKKEEALGTGDNRSRSQATANDGSARSDSVATAPVSPNAPGLIDCTVIDGDTVNCGGRRLRLLGVDAPELPGHCRPGRTCLEGNPFAATMALERLLNDEHLQIVVSGKDSYGRDLVNIYASGRNIACDLIAGGHVTYIPKWDDGGIVSEDCAISGF